MTSQLALDYAPRKMARTSDPESAHIAAAKVDTKEKRWFTTEGDNK